VSAELRDEAADGPAAQKLWAEYMALVAERVEVPPASPEAVFATPEAFGDGAWVVAYEEGEPVACGGLRRLDATTGEIKRMFVTARARGRGHGRTVLSELEARARAAGMTRVRLLTTEVLVEARALYADAGYRVVGAPREGDRQDYWLEKEFSTRAPRAR
jgi:GNAT superfamily N-acetyltransferase